MLTIDMVVLRMFGILLLLHVPGVRTSTLYQWIVDSQTRFNYDPDPSNRLGVYNWPRTYSESCGGEHQSPIDIQTDRVRYGVLCQCPRMIYQSTRMRGLLENNGHSPTFEPDSPMLFKLTNVPYRSGNYYLNDFHLHYGGVRGRDFELQGRRFRGSGIMSAGSEHTIDGLRFEGELHFVFFNGKYMDLEHADNKSDGVVVFVILVQKIPDSMVDNGETSRFSRLLEDTIPLITAYQSNASIEIDMSIFFNRDCEFYTYAGSTTTPTCHESVRWLILREPIRVTERAWFLLTQLQSRGDFNSRFGNYRTTQPLNDRVVEANFRREIGVIRPRPNGPPSPDIPTNMTSPGVNQPMTVSGGNDAIPNLDGNIQNPPMIGAMQSDMVMMQTGGIRPNLNENTGNVLMSFGVSPRNAMSRPAPVAMVAPAAAGNNNDNSNRMNTMLAMSMSRPVSAAMAAPAAAGNNNDNTNLMNTMLSMSRPAPAPMTAPASENSMATVSITPFVARQTLAAGGNNNDNNNGINNMISRVRPHPAVMMHMMLVRNNDNGEQRNAMSAMSAVSRKRTSVGIDRMDRQLGTSGSLRHIELRPQHQSRKELRLMAASLYNNRNAMKRPSSMAASLHRHRKQQMRRKMIIRYWKPW